MEEDRPTTAAMTGRKSVGKRWITNIGVMVIAVCISLMLVEVGFRFYGDRLLQRRIAAGNLPVVVAAASAHRPSKDPELVYEFGPSLSLPGHPNFTNSAGLRGPERPLANPPNTIRIAGIGDSVMAGDFYPYDKTFMFVLEDMLNEATTSGVRFESINFAVSGYNTRDEAITLRKKALAYDPDWAILGIVANDRERNAYYRVREEDGTLKLISREYVENVVPFSAGFEPGRKPWWARSAFARWLHYRSFMKRDHRAGVARFCEAFADLAETCRTNDVSLLAVILTEDVHVDYPENPRRLWHDLIREQAANADVPVLDMYPAILEHLKRNGISSYSHYWTDARDQHPDPEGHRLLARLIFEKLKALGILQDKPD